MEIRFQSMAKPQPRCGCMLTMTYADDAGTMPRFATGPLDWLAATEGPRDHRGTARELTLCYGPTGSSVPRVLLVGLGARADLTLEVFRQAVAAAVRRCKTLGVARLGLVLDELTPLAADLGIKQADLVREAILAALLAAYSFTDYRSTEAKTKGKKDNAPDFFTFESFTFFLPPGKSAGATVRAAAHLAEAEAGGVSFARNLVNAPANRMTPAHLADEATALARRHGFGCRVLHKQELVTLGMGALLAVNEGSGKEPRLISLEFTPRSTKKRQPLVVVGKGITFDSGGISLKPAPNMHHMKGDMAGAAAVLGLFEAIGRHPEGITTPIVGLIPCTENMPDGLALRPGDVITTYSGKTVEVLNTDAEGRLILCDALSYAQRNWNPLAVVDIATLTGACMVALGSGAAGLFTENAPLRDTIKTLGDTLGDTFWPMPLWARLREGLQSTVADLANVGEREGGAITAALFLQSFVDKKVPWAHLDMAGAGLAGKDAPLCPKGGTGFGVRTLFGLARATGEQTFMP